MVANIAIERSLAALPPEMMLSINLQENPDGDKCWSPDRMTAERKMAMSPTITTSQAITMLVRTSLMGFGIVFSAMMDAKRRTLMTVAGVRKNSVKKRVK